MSSKSTRMIGVLTLTLINLGTLAVNLSIKAHAEVAGMDWFKLAKDDDFRQAVGYVVGQCTVDMDQSGAISAQILCGR